MALAPGTHLGPYEIVSALGAGGMGEVYRARDTRLDRSVALKVLPAEVASDPDRRARFEREARAIAALSHPNICVVHDVGRATIDGAAAPVDYLVMEHLEGDTLAERLARAEAPLSVADTVRIAGDITAALDAAHRSGIVHRDLKPANVMLTKSGAKLLDFGIAKWRTPQDGRGQAFSTTVSGDTAQGTLVGTVHYMAPEQVEGQAADARSDIWACGVVLYEMCTGRRPFEGASTASVIGAILRDAPEPLTGRGPIVPVVLDRIVSRCLQKDPEARWQTAADLRAALDLVAPGTAPLTGAAAHVTSAPPSRRRWQWVVAAVVGAGVIFGGGAFLGQRMRPPASLPQLVQFDVPPPADAMFSPAPVAGTAQFALSPDGGHLAFVAARRRGVSQIYVRSLNANIARPLAATEGASFPFWSSDSRSIGFFAGGKLKKVALAGGVQVLADAPAGRGGAWSPDGTILFSPTPNGPIFRVPSVGGTPSPATTQDATGADTARVVGHNWPAMLPDGRFLYYQRAGNLEHQGIFQSDAAGPASTPTMVSDGLALYSSGHLLLVRDGTLIAQPLDAGTLRPVGEPARIADGVAYFRGSFGHSAIAATPDGVLAYALPIATATRLRWIDRSGSRFVDVGDPGPYVSPRLSADGRTVAVAISGSMDERDVWLLDVSRNTMSRATSDPGADWFPAWSPNGDLFFGSTRPGLTTMFRKTGVQPETRVDDGGPRLAVYPHDVSSDGTLILNVQSAARGYDIGVTTLGTPPVWTSFLSTNFSEVQPRFSPDQRWVAYASDESGRFEIYVRPYPASDAQWRISSGGGMQPEWRGDGKELYYVSADGKMMAVPVTPGARMFESGTAQALFDVETPEAVAPYPGHYTVTQDGQRFLVNTVIDQPSRPAITVMLNWPRALTSPPD